MLPKKLNLLIIAFSYAALVGLLLVFIKPMPTSGENLAVIGSMIAAIACIYWSQTRLGPGQDFARFQTNTLVSLALAEMIALLGMFVAGTNAWMYAVAAWALMAALIIPRILAQ